MSRTLGYRWRQVPDGIARTAVTLFAAMHYEDSTDAPCRVLDFPLGYLDVHLETHPTVINEARLHVPHV